MPWPIVSVILFQGRAEPWCQKNRILSGNDGQEGTDLLIWLVADVFARRIASGSTWTAYASLSFLRLLGFAAIICRSQSQSIIGPGVCSDFLCGDGVVNPLLDVEHSCSFFGGNYTTFIFVVASRRVTRWESLESSRRENHWSLRDECLVGEIFWDLLLF